MSFKLLKKIVSIFTLAAFMSTNIVYAAPESKSIFKNKKVDYHKLSDKNEGVIQKKKVILNGEDTSQSELQKKEVRKVLSSHLSDLSLIHIPEELGKVVEVYQNPGQDNSKLVVHIQDLHTNPEASLNLAKILDILIKDYKMGMVCSEGADGIVDTSSVSSFPDADVKEKVARLFIDSGELTGEEYLSITKYPELPIWGIENKDIYFKNIVEFNNIMKFNPSSQVFISQVKKALEELKPKIYSKELLAIDQKELDYDNQKIETVDYLKHLSIYIQKLNIPTANYKNVALLDETMNKESKIDQQKIMQESQNLLLNLQSAITGKSNRADMDTLMAKASLFKDQKISPFSFYSYLKDLANKHLKDQLSKYPNLMDFVDYLTKVNSLDSTKLFMEMAELTYEIKQKLARNDEEKALTQNLRNIKFLEGFFNLKVSNEELDYYLENRGSHKTGWFESFLKPAIKKYNISSFVDFNPNLIDSHLQELEDFYKTAKSRDLVMFNNSVSEIEKRNIKVSALITGGFHTKGLTRLLKDKGYSYIVISPYSKTGINEENYHFLLSGKRKPIEELINQLDLSKSTDKVSKNLRVPVTFDSDMSSAGQDNRESNNKLTRNRVREAINMAVKLGSKETLVNYEIGKAAVNNEGGNLIVFVPENENIGFVVKDPRENKESDVIYSFMLAKEGLGGIGAKTTLVKNATFIINGQKHNFNVALLQERVTPLKEKIRSSSVEEAKRLLDEMFSIERQMYLGHLHLLDHKIEDYGITAEGKLVLSDFTGLSINKNDFYIIGKDDDRNMLLRNITFLKSISSELADYFLAREIKFEEFDSLWKSGESRIERLADVDLTLPVSLPKRTVSRSSFMRKDGAQTGEEERSFTTYASWSNFERDMLSGRELSQRERNLSEPQKIAFNIDAFPKSREVLLQGSVHRIFDSIFRLLEGNPNFMPVAIFLGDYAEGMPSSFERLAEFLRTNPIMGNSKYKVRFDADNNQLIINGQQIALYNGFATPEYLRKLGVNFLIEATRQRDLTSEKKEADEIAQRARIDGYFRASQGLKVIVIAPEEDKGVALAETPVVYKVNTAASITPESRMIVLAEPVTTVAGIMCKIVDDTVASLNPRANVSISSVRVIRTDREGNRLLDTQDTKPGLALNRILSKGNAVVPGNVSDVGAISGANAIEVVLNIKGFMSDLTPDMINEAFRKAGREEGLFRGIIDYKGKATVSGFETFNQHPVIFIPMKAEDLQVVKPPDGVGYRKVVLRGFYSEFGYAKSMLDLMTGLSMFNGNQVKREEIASLKAPEGTIPQTSENLRLQIMPDGNPIKVVLNSARGRMAIGLQRRLWFDPNFKIVGINGVRPQGQDITALFLEHDEVYGEAPFTVQLTSDGKSFKFTDREESVTEVNDDTRASSEIIGDVRSTILRTPYGNLYIEDNQNTIKSMRLHGEEVSNMNIADNKNGTFSAQGRLRNGTTVRLTYSQGAPGEFSSLISSAIKKQEIIPFTNIRANGNEYKQGKKETNADFLKRVENYNRTFAREVMANMPWLNEEVLFMEASGQLTESMKLRPFYLAGSGAGIISAPAKSEISGVIPTDITVVPGVSAQYFLSAWDIIKTASCASCTTNAAAVGAKALLSFLYILSGNFNTVHAITNTQGRMFGEIPSGSKSELDRAVDARHHIAFSSTGASKELGTALPELLNIVSGVSLRVANDDGSIVNYTFQVKPKIDAEIPNAEKINEMVKELTQIPEKAGGLKGFLGYGTPKSSVEIIGSEIGGIFDPSKTVVDRETETVSISIWYDNEGGYVNQYVNLALLMGLYRRERAREIGIVAQNVVATQGAYTGRVTVASAKKSGANFAFIGLGQFRSYEDEANRFRLSGKKVDVDVEANKALREALNTGIDPILNIYINDVDQRRGVQDSINRQVSGAFMDIPPEDITRVAISFEMANEVEPVNTLAEYIGIVRKAISGYVARAFISQIARDKENLLKEIGTTGYNSYIGKMRAVADGVTEAETINNYGELLGANVSQKARVLIRFNNPVIDETAIRKLTNLADIDGFMFSSQFKLDKLRSMAGIIDKEISVSPAKKLELNKRRSPRFFIGASLGSSLEFQQIVTPNGTALGSSFSSYIDALSSMDSHNIQLAIAPPLTELKSLSSLLKGQVMHERVTSPDKTPVRVLLQNATLGDNKDGFVDLEYAVRYLGIHDVLFAHSEQIELTGISDSEIARLAKRAHQLKKEGTLTGNIIVAVGEVLADYEAGNSGSIVRDQILNRFKGLTSQEIADTIIAYEPRWAISGAGTGRMCTPEEIQKRHAEIRSAIKDVYGLEASQKVRIIYGGSVTVQNAEEILKLRDVDGALSGAASTSPEAFSSIVSIAEKLADSKNSSRPFYRKFYIAGNHKAMEIKESYPKFVNMNRGADRKKVEVAIGPDLSRILDLVEVYAKDPLKDIVFVDQLSPEEINGKTFFVRVDFNAPMLDIKAVPSDPDTWQITGNARIMEAMPTINYLRRNGGIVVLVSHFEPKGVNLKGAQSIRFLVPTIENLLGDGTKVTFVGDILGSGRQGVLKGARAGDVILFENVRLDKKIAELEKADTNTPDDVAKRAKLASSLYAGPNDKNPTANVVIVTDGFGVTHRNQASVTGEVKGVPRIGGLLFKKELTFGIEALRIAKPPRALIFGGGPKIADKVPMLRNIVLNTLTEGDKIFVYGGAAMPFLMAKYSSFEPGKSRALFDEATVNIAREVMELAEEQGIEIVLPVDFMISDGLPSDETQQVTTKVVSKDNVTPGVGAYDIGPETIKRFREEIIDERGKSRFGLIINNGPAGAFEYEQFRGGTQAVFDIMAKATKTDENPDGAITMLGGGDTGYAAELLGVDKKVSFVSTGGGAFLELLEGRDLPGVEALRGKAGEFSYHLNSNIQGSFDRMRGALSDYASQAANEPASTLASNAGITGKQQVDSMDASTQEAYDSLAKLLESKSITGANQERISAILKEIPEAYDSLVKLLESGLITETNQEQFFSIFKEIAQNAGSDTWIAYNILSDLAKSGLTIEETVANREQILAILKEIPQYAGAGLHKPGSTLASNEGITGKQQVNPIPKAKIDTPEGTYADLVRLFMSKPTTEATREQIAALAANKELISDILSETPEAYDSLVKLLESGLITEANQEQNLRDFSDIFKKIAQYAGFDTWKVYDSIAKLVKLGLITQARQEEILAILKENPEAYDSLVKQLKSDLITEALAILTEIPEAAGLNKPGSALASNANVTGEEPVAENNTPGVYDRLVARLLKSNSIREADRKEIFTLLEVNKERIPAILKETPEAYESLVKLLESGLITQANQEQIFAILKEIPRYTEIETPKAYDSLTNLVKSVGLTTETVANREQILAILKEIPKAAGAGLNKPGSALASNADITRKQQVDSLDQIIAVSADSVIANKEGFETWIAQLPENNAVVIIAASEEYDDVKGYENIAYIKVIGKDIDQEYGLKLIELFNVYGNPNLFGGFKLGTPVSLDEYKTVVGQIASGV